MKVILKLQSSIIISFLSFCINLTLGYVMDDINRCIGSNNCDRNRNCSSFVLEKNCLTTRIPPWTTTNSIISCCFKCCLQHYLHSYNLIGSKISSSTKLKIDDLDYAHLLIGSNFTYPLSSQIITASSLYGNVSIFQITTLSSGNFYAWASLRGRRVVVISNSLDCSKAWAASTTIRAFAPFGNPRVSYWFTNQIPCEWEKEVFTPFSNSINTPNINDSNSQDSIPSVTDKNNNNNNNLHGKKKPKKGDPTISSTILKKMHIIPTGARDPKLLSQIFNKYSIINNNENKINLNLLSDTNYILNHLKNHTIYRNQLIYCQCAEKFSKEGSKVVNMLRNNGLCLSLNEEIKLQKSIQNIIKSKNVLEIEYIKLLLFRYSLSPSYLIHSNIQDNKGSQSYCEWEAMAAGIIPIIKQPFNHLLQQFIHSLPMVILPDWNHPLLSSPKVLLESYSNLKQQLSTTAYSISSLYLPALLAQLLPGLLTSKPPSRFFGDMKMALSRNHPKCLSHKISINEREAVEIEENNMTQRLRILLPPNDHSLVTSIVSCSLEFVLPRCCEDGLEFDWLYKLLKFAPYTCASIYYKCPSCLPNSMALSWSNSHYAKQLNLNQKLTRGIRAMDDTLLLSYGNRVKQFINIDSVYNAKEVSAYLGYILSRYDSFSNHVMFLHTTPHAHLYFELFFRALKWVSKCSKPIDFLHLNVKYKTGKWGACCGKKSSCRNSTWSWLDMDMGLLNKVGGVSTYSSAQFIVSKEKLLSKPRRFYEKMLLAINGSHDLVGCPSNSEPGKVWGGHQLTGQYERMWHVIYGHHVRQDVRVKDETLPPYLRLDCYTWQCLGAL